MIKRQTRANKKVVLFINKMRAIAKKEAQHQEQH